MKIPNTTSLQDLSNAFTGWRRTKTIRSEPVPFDLRKLAAEALHHFSLKDVISATGLLKYRVVSFRDEFFPDLKLDESKVPKRKPKNRPVVHMSEIKVSPSLIPKEKAGRIPSTLVASIDDRFGRSLKIFSDAGDPSSLIQSFLGAELEVVR
jgi:hypothetical protein